MQAVKQAMSIDTLFLIITSSAYCGLNVLLNDYNAFLFGSGINQRNLEVPLFYTASNFVLSTCVWTPALLCIGPRTSCAPNVQKCAGFLNWEAFRKHWPMLVMLSLSISVSTASQNASPSRLRATERVRSGVPEAASYLTTSASLTRSADSFGINGRARAAEVSTKTADIAWNPQNQTADGYGPAMDSQMQMQMYPCDSRGSGACRASPPGCYFAEDAKLRGWACVTVLVRG